MGCKRLLGVVGGALLALCGTGAAGPAAAATRFTPRIGHAMGIVAPLQHAESAVTPREPAVFHGGVVMHGVRVHTVFWAPAGYGFSGPPADGVPGYEPVLQRFLADVAHDSSASDNVFSILDQYGDGSGRGTYSIAYDPTVDSIDDPTPYPAAKAQCDSPTGIPTCLTDLEVERELDRVVAARDPGGRGVHDLWILLLPPNVDECVLPGQCGTSQFAGYHSLFDLGHGETIYAVIVDPVIEGVFGSGADPEGNPDAESAADVIAHEVVEAITDPEGTGWMDPDGGEIGDKCENSIGAPLGSAADSSPYNQDINGRPYLLQTMWSNVVSGCVVHGGSAPSPALPQVDLRQFSANVSGATGVALARLSVQVGLLRGGDLVAEGVAATDAAGRWRATLRSDSGAPVAVGDDRDEIAVRYGHGGPAGDLISTDSGGNPFSQAGWTGWFDLDHGATVGPSSVAIAPCSQTGVLALRVGGVLQGSPVAQCQTENDFARLITRPIGPGTSVTLSSTDNRAVWEDNSAGAVVRLTVSLGEPRSVSEVTNDQVFITPTGFATCTADLVAQTVRCAGLIAHARYRLTRRRGRVARSATASSDGEALFRNWTGSAGLRGGDLLTLRNRANRALTALHVAHLRVALRGTAAEVAAGTCQPGEYWGAPVSSPPVGPFTGAPTVGGSGAACPSDGDASGLPVATLEQTDSFSGGATRIEVPGLGSFSPRPGATLYGDFIAVALPAWASGRPAPARVTLRISRRGSRRVVARASGVQRAQGVRVRGLAPGVYSAAWTLTDAAGDTRTVSSYFVEAG